MFSFEARQFFGRLVYSGLYKLDGGKPSGKIWCKKENPRK
ncbi:hypothetical protein LEP1GSC070_2662 [Leptospira santarosai str. AIM]|nr:hypothetical protein LEP1GSC070_2662 [Leptospira santarosai str. AIM]